MWNDDYKEINLIHNCEADFMTFIDTLNQIFNLQ